MRSHLVLFNDFQTLRLCLHDEDTLLVGWAGEHDADVRTVHGYRSGQAAGEECLHPDDGEGPTRAGERIPAGRRGWPVIGGRGGRSSGRPTGQGHPGCRRALDYPRFYIRAQSLVAECLSRDGCRQDADGVDRCALYTGSQGQPGRHVLVYPGWRAGSPRAWHYWSL